jgi:hypothetical protein
MRNDCVEYLPSHFCAKSLICTNNQSPLGTANKTKYLSDLYGEQSGIRLAIGSRSRGHAVFHDGQWFNVYCFSDPANAEKFTLKFGGQKFDPKQRGKESDWARWRKPSKPFV